jgi:aspartate racemase
MKRFGTVGVVGGMGPEATLDLYKEIIFLTPAEKDQEHIPMVIYNNPTIPDRTAGILYKGENPLPELIKSVQKVEQSGADFIILPCNTSHYYIEDLRAFTNIPIVSMIEETLSFIQKRYPSVKRLGLLATTGTIKAEIYHRVFNPMGIEIITLPIQDQEYLVMEAIYGKNGIKAGCKDYPNNLLTRAVNKLAVSGAQLLMMGCTEIPLVLNQEEISTILINPTRILAERAIELSMNSQKLKELILVEEDEEE